MFIEREGVIILHLHPPQSAYMEAAVSVQAVALTVHCCYSVRILCCFTVSLASLHCQDHGGSNSPSRLETIKGDSQHNCRQKYSKIFVKKYCISVY